MSKEQIEELRKVFAAKNPAGVVVDKDIKSTSQFKEASERLKKRRDSLNKPSDLDTYSEMVQWHDASERIKGARYFSGWRGEPSKEAIEAEVEKHLKAEQARANKAATDIQKVFRGHQGRKEAEKQLITKLASGETQESLEREKRLAQERLQQGQWFKRFRSGPDDKVVLAEVMAERKRKAEIRQDRFTNVEQRRQELTEINQEKRSQAELKRKAGTSVKVAESKAKREQRSKNVEASRERRKLEKPAVDFARSLDEATWSHSAHNPYTIMSKAIEIANTSGNFDKAMFMFSMKTILLGPDFKDFKEKLAEKDRKKFEAAEAKLDTDLMQLSESVDKGLKDKTLDKPQENGIIKKCIINVTKTVGLIAGLTVITLGVMNMGVTKIIGENKVSTKLNLSLGFVMFSIKDFIDSNTRSSAVEAEMDRMVENVDKNFNKYMSSIAAKYHKQAPDAEVTDEDRIKAEKRMQGKKWFGGMKSGPSAEDVEAEAKADKAQKMKESEAVKVANRFQDRFTKIKNQGPTFAGREKARKADEDKDKGVAK